MKGHNWTVLPVPDGPGDEPPPRWRCVRCGSVLTSDLLPGVSGEFVLRRTEMSLSRVEVEPVRSRIAVIMGDGSGDHGLMNADCDIELVRRVMES